MIYLDPKADMPFKKAAIAEGRAEGVKEVAAKMKRLGIPAEQIAQSTGISLEEIGKM